MVALVGAQAAPNVLPLTHFDPNRLVLVYTRTTKTVAENTQALLASDQPNLEVNLLCLEDAYHLEHICDQLETYLNETHNPGCQVIFNLTGGTKVMSFAALELTKRTSSRAFYYQSEENKSEVHNFHFEHDALIIDGSEPINPDLTLDQYLRLYLRGYNSEKRDPMHIFENLVLDALKCLGDGFEVVERIRPQNESDNELDCVIRCGSVIAVVEIKTKATKKTVEEVNNMTARYLGAYRKKIIVHANTLYPGMQDLVRAYQIICIHLPSYKQSGDTALSEDDKVNL
jgi:Holliday junction resolvase-like predicted endonuclease